jgi:hypothetical protein
VNAKVGLQSGQIIGRVHDADVVVLSAGSNDAENPRLLDNLKAMRAKATHKVLWIVPLDRRAEGAVLRAAHPDDLLVTLDRTNDGMHPKFYGPLIKQVDNAIANAATTAVPVPPVSDPKRDASAPHTVRESKWQ